jgi:hypothetical protein
MASGATGTYGLPYPLQTDGVDVAADVQSLATAVEIELLLKAPLDSPTFIGNPTAPTPSNSDNDTSIATTAFVKNQSYLTTTLAASTYAPLASPTFTGTVTTPLTTAGIVTTTAGGVLGSTTLVPIANGGTNSSAAATAGGVGYGTGTAHAYTSAGISGQFLQSNGSGAPTWANVVGSLYQASAPGSPQTGTLWTDSDTDVLYVYNGSSWHSPMGIERNPQTASYTLALTDRAKLVEISNASANTLTVPANATVAFPIGTQIQILQTGAGQTTLTPASITTATYSSGGAAAATTFVISTSNANIAVGQLVTGTGFAANTLVTNVAGTTITVSPAIVSQVSGTITFSVGLVATPGLKLRTQWSSATIVKRDTNTWVAIGDLSA